MTSVMRAAVFTGIGGPEVIRVEQRPIPQPAHGEVLIRVHASAMNRADVLQRQGRYPPPPGAPLDVGGLELAGSVVALGTGAQRWRAGDRVFGLVSGGAHADFVVAQWSTLALVPRTLSWTDAGATPEAFITAHDALEQAAAREGDYVLVHAVASGVGLAAVQLIRARRATPLGTSRNAEKLERAHDFGLAAGFPAEHGVDGLSDWVLSRTENHGADIVLELVGGAYVPASVKSMAMRGRLMLIGHMAGAEATVPLNIVLRQRLTIRGTVLRSRAFDERAHDARVFERDVVPLLEQGTVRPVVDTVFPLERIADAHRLVEGNQTFGKVVIRMTDEEA
jgi:putative PIG3 family NAD(P)H quinone oxidoreductase